MKYWMWMILMPWLCFSQQTIGGVVAVYGNAIAVRPGGEEAVLDKDAPIYLNDMIRLDQNSIMQFKLSDGSLLNLSSGAQYRINQYSFQSNPNHNYFMSEILQGGLRVVTGSIGKANPQGVEIQTPTAVIGLRGTIFEVFISGEGTFVGCEMGEIVVSNNTGHLSLGPRLGSQFGIVSSLESTPNSISSRPPPLSLNRFMLPRGCG